jgi:hypothetical protein
MSHRVLLVLALLLGSPALCQQEGPSQASVATEPALTGRLVVEDGFRTLYLWGTPEERGFAHGWLLAPEIMACVNEDFGWLLERLPGVGTALYKSVLLRGVIPHFEFRPEEIAEMKGLLEGLSARLSEEERTVTAIGRPLELQDLMAANTAGDWVALGCATFVAGPTMTASGAPAAARNFDFPGLKAVLDYQFALVVDPGPGRRPYLGVGHPGGIGLLTAMNSEGVFLSIHDVPVKARFEDARRRNTPRLLALRRLVEETSARGAVESAAAVLRSWTTLYGNNFMVVTPDPGEGHAFAGVVESDRRENVDEGATLRIAEPEETGGRFLACTNHHRLRQGRSGLGARPCWRYQRFLEAGQAAVPERPLGVAELFAIIDATAFPRRGGPQLALEHGTLHQAVALTGPREFHLRFGVVGESITKRPVCRLVLDAELERLRGFAAAK